MNISAPFILRPVATTLLTAAIAIAGLIAFQVLPVSPLPQVDFPTISVSAELPGASAEIMASSVATPLERQFGHIAGITEMTSASSLGTHFDHHCNLISAATSTARPAMLKLASMMRAVTYPPTCRPIPPIARSIPPMRRL